MPGVRRIAWATTSRRCGATWAGSTTSCNGGLRDADLRAWVEDADQGRYHLLRLMSDNPGVGDWLRFKAELVEEMLAGFRRVMNEEGARQDGDAPERLPAAVDDSFGDGLPARRAFLARRSVASSTRCTGR